VNPLLYDTLLSQEEFDSYKQIKCFLRHIGFPYVENGHQGIAWDERLDERIAFFTKNNPEWVYALLARINRMVRRASPMDTDPTYNPEIYIAGDSFTEPRGDKTGDELALWFSRRLISARYVAPANGIVLLKDFYAEMQRRLTPELVDRYATKLDVAIYMAHMFPDGNTRTTRVVSDLLRFGRVIPKHMIDEIYPQLSSIVLKLAVFNVIRAALATCAQKDVPEIATIDDLHAHLRLDPKYTLGMTRGLAMTLQFVALMKARPELTWAEIRAGRGVPVLLVTPGGARVGNIPLALEVLGEEPIYHGLQRAVFDEAQRIIDARFDMNTIVTDLCRDLTALGEEC